MKQVININFHGQVVPIEVSAFDLLKSYTDSLARFFANEEGKEEIINDIESRIGELFQEKLKKGATCITDDDVNAIIKSMGRPEEFDGEEEKVVAALGSSQNSSSAGSQNSNFATGRRLYRDENHKVLGGVCSGLANYFGTDSIIIRIIFIILAFAGAGVLAYIILWIAVPSTASTEVGGVLKKLYRDPDDKIIAGVCSGIGNYFGVSAWVPRILFLLPFLSIVFRIGDWGFTGPADFFNFSFSPGSLIVYIILWLVFPEANTTAEKLEMKGEKVDMNSIKNSVVEEMKGVGKRAERFGEEAKTFAAEKGQQMGAELKTAAKRGGRSLGDIIVMFVKVIAYIIIGVVGVVLVGLLFFFAIMSIGIFPYKAYLLTDGWQNALAWGTLIFFIAVPVIGVIAWIIRRLAKIKTNRNLLRGTFIGLWIVGWVCFVCLAASVTKDFKSINNISEQEIMLSNPGVNKMEVTTNSLEKKLYRYNSFRIEPFEGIDEDSAYIKNIEVKIVKAAGDSFKVTMTKLANGRSRRFADTLANMIKFDVVQKDSLLVLDKGIAINTTDKFRNQRVVITVYVPVGKQIKVNRNIGWGSHIRFGGPWNENDFDIDIDDEENGWDEGVDYIMKADGLYTLDGTPADEWKHQNDKKIKVNEDGIEINDGNKKIKVDGNGVKVESSSDNYRYDSKSIEKTDSLQQKLDMEKKRKADSLRKELEKIEGKKEIAYETATGTASSYQMPLFIHL
ncbi:MAG: PspC domain-containing protein [Chitinophagaceae bacterium]|nr:PspC domain-containing protein [Chitinophagaceae bacterium]